MRPTLRSTRRPPNPPGGVGRYSGGRSGELSPGGGNDPDTFHPTLLPRLAHALDAQVDPRLVPGETSDVTFSGRAA
ncbi:hypothetical protein ACFV5N_18455 [Streptomyces sp. NPDC059853]|uniref:hypothetical protein n=1 Tax=Streptomyces sp. NPDC059853 TaxID=3346973 RepID=UPI00365E3679